MQQHQQHQHQHQHQQQQQMQFILSSLPCSSLKLKCTIQIPSWNLILAQEDLIYEYLKSSNYLESWLLLVSSSYIRYGNIDLMIASRWIAAQSGWIQNYWIKVKGGLLLYKIWIKFTRNLLQLAGCRLTLKWTALAATHIDRRRSQLHQLAPPPPPQDAIAICAMHHSTTAL